MRYADDEVLLVTLISVFGGLEEPPVKVNPVIRDSQEPEGSSVKAGEEVTITRPWPLIVRHLELGISTAPPYETVPAGTMIVSPLEAELTHACTSEAAAVAALHVGEPPEQPAKHGAALPKQASIAMSRRVFLIIIPR